MSRKLVDNLAHWSDTTLSIALVAVAILLVAIALMRKQTIAKAIVLAWVLLP